MSTEDTIVGDDVDLDLRKRWSNERAKNIRRNGEESGACLGVPSIAPGQSVTVAPPEQRCATRMFEFQMV